MSDTQLALYSNNGCPFCHRVLRAMDDLPLTLEVRHTTQPQHRQELIQGGGRATVPCLRIEQDGQVKWLYESLDIIAYLHQHCQPS